MAATDTDSMHDNMTRLRMKMVQQKLANERERLQRPDSASSNDFDGDVKLQQAMLRRQELLDRIRQEQLINDDERRPRTYSPRRRYTPSPLPPPSRRSLPDLNRNYHFSWYHRDPRGPYPERWSQAALQPQQNQEMATKHIIEHQFRQAEPSSKTFVLPPIVNPQPQVIQAPQPIIQQLPPAVTYNVDGGAPRDNRNTFFNKADFMDMMMLQNAQMHHMVMQQMMLHNLPNQNGGGGGGGGWRLPTAQIPLAPVMAEPAMMRAAPLMSYAAPAAAPVIHHYQSVPPLDIRGGGYGGGGRVLKKGIQGKPSNGPIVVRTDVVRKPSAPYPFPGPDKLRRLRHLAWAAWFIAHLQAEARKNKGNNRPSSVFLFGIILKEIVAALHRVYLNPKGNIYPVLGDIIGSGAQDLSELVGEGGRLAEQDRLKNYQVLQYVMENLIYHITEIMPKTGVLGTHKKAAVYELIKNGKRFPDGYFWQIELDRLQFNNNGRTVNVGDNEAFLLLVGMFLSRSLITTLLMKPIDYGLSNDALSDIAERNLKVLATIMLFLVRRVSTPRDAPMMPMPGEVARYVFSDEEMRNVHLRLRRSYEYCENLLREWGTEYIRRLRAATNVK